MTNPAAVESGSMMTAASPSATSSISFSVVSRSLKGRTTTLSAVPAARPSVEATGFGRSAGPRCGPSGGVECQGAGSYDGIVKYKEIVKKLEPFQSKVYPDEEGNFEVKYRLRGGIFESGTYSVTASYFGEKAETQLRVYKRHAHK